MPKLSHEQFDEKVTGLAATYEALSALDFTPGSLTNGDVKDDVVYGSISEAAPLGFDLSRGVNKALQSLRFDIGCWGRLAHDSSVYIDEASTDKRLEMAGVLAMMTAPNDEEKFNEVALSIYELFDNVAQGNRVVIERPGERRFIGGEFKDDIQESGEHNGKIRVTFENGHISSRVISIWSDRPENIHSETSDGKGFHRQVVFPLLHVDLEALAGGKLAITYPSEELVA